MLLAKENLEWGGGGGGMCGVTVKYATFPKDVFGIVYGETDYYFFLRGARLFI